VSRANFPAATSAALQLAALETVKAIGAGPGYPGAGRLITIDMTAMASEAHTLVRRPQCPRCGDPALGPERDPLPVIAQSQKKVFVADGGHRTVAPEVTLAKYAHHVSAITGAVTSITRMTVDDDDQLHVYVAGHAMAGRADNLDKLRFVLMNKSGGKGASLNQARASGLCEALERVSGCYQGDEIRMQATFAELGDRAIHPNACLLFSDKQYREREPHNVHPVTERIPDGLEERAQYDWTPVWSFTEQRFKYVLSAYCYYGYPQRPGPIPCWADSNGNAAGNTLEEAILQGFMELVERDSIALWWYNRVRRPAVDLTSFDDHFVQEMQWLYAKQQREIWALDISSDLGIPAIAAMARRIDGGAEEILLGFGAHFDARIALRRALTELNQSLHAVKTITGEDARQYRWENKTARAWWKTATLANQPYLAPTDGSHRRLQDFPVSSSDDLRDDILRCQNLVEQRGMEMLVLDQTRPDIGLSVAKVIVPGLRHFWQRFAPGRLYDVSVQLGWMKEPLEEDDLNPIGMYF
jgi:ribosomal protein S12 methylthiotransferase accessory factor